MQVQSVGKLQNTVRNNESLTESSVGDAIEGYIVNVAREMDEEPVRIPQSISAKLKPHQVPFTLSVLVVQLNFNFDRSIFPNP